MKNCKNCGNINCGRCKGHAYKLVDENYCVKMNYSQWKSRIAFFGMDVYSDDELADLSDQFEKFLEYARNKDNG